MNNFDLNAMGVSEMNEVEMKQAEGGFLDLIIIGAVAGIIVSFVDNFGDFRDGLRMGRSVNLR